MQRISLEKIQIFLTSVEVHKSFKCSFLIDYASLPKKINVKLEIFHVIGACFRMEKNHEKV